MYRTARTCYEHRIYVFILRCLFCKKRSVYCTLHTDVPIRLKHPSEMPLAHNQLTFEHISWLIARFFALILGIRPSNNGDASGEQQKAAGRTPLSSNNWFLKFADVKYSYNGWLSVLYSVRVSKPLPSPRAPEQIECSRLVALRAERCHADTVVMKYSNCYRRNK